FGRIFFDEPVSTSSENALGLNKKRPLDVLSNGPESGRKHPDRAVGADGCQYQQVFICAAMQQYSSCTFVLVGNGTPMVGRSIPR
ncbi:MAG TPA: hypothetical protein P5114_12930, partial [Hyphomicrobiaceae bacterium]|nr:hypothetical protein [Hyphomicrobiaceae bacterium]